MKKIILVLLIVHCSLFIAKAQWTQQSLPTTAQIFDIAFLNKDTGFVAVNANQFFRTTNGGTNWDSISNFRIYVMNAIDDTTLYGISPDGTKFYRTFNGGTNWDVISTSGYCYISFINKDTGWISSLGGILKTTNGGLSAALISTDANCGRLNFLEQKYNNEYCGFYLTGDGFTLRKTTNSGINWINVTNSLGSGRYSSIFFLNKDTGWSYFVYNIRPWEFIYTSNGGTNWITQYIDSGSHPAGELFFLNEKKGWGGRGIFRTWATSNGGYSWGTQYNPLFASVQLSFIHSLLGWSGTSGIVKTTNGGGVITYIGFDSNNTQIPTTFILNQNYPNPFNPQTTIEFSISKNSNVNLIIYDIAGKEILKLYDKESLIASNYKAVIDFGKLNVSSGVYFYTLKVVDERSTQIFNQTKKMIFNK